MRGMSVFIVSLLFASVSALAGDAAVSGAKDLFYDPAGGSVSVKVDLPQPASSNSHALSAKAVPTAAKSKSLRPITPPSAPGQAAAAKNRGLHYWVELEEPGSEGVYVTDRQVFHSGQRIRLHFVSNSDGRILLVQMGASGTSTLLFPDPGKGLAENRIRAGEDRILPGEAHWFRFDANAGTERLLVMFARDDAELDRFPVKPKMGPAETKSLLQTASHIEGSKDLVIETETRTASEVGTYGVNLKGEPVILEISLQHR
jgi:hypothetical protein